MKSDVSEFCIKLWHAKEVYDKHNDEDSLARNISSYAPTKRKRKALDLLCEHITIYSYELVNKQKHKPNFRKRDWNDLNKLK